MQVSSLMFQLNLNPLTDNTTKVFFSYAIPSVIGLLAFSSTQIIDAIFIGHYMGGSGLAALNLAMPVISIAWGISLMITIGGNVLTSNAIGSKKKLKAYFLFSQTVIATAIAGILCTVILLLLLPNLLYLLGSTPTLAPLLEQFLLYYLMFLPAMFVAIALYYLSITDNRPFSAFIAIFLSSLTNFFLDWLFIAQWQWQLKGAAMATGISMLVLISLLGFGFYAKSQNLRLILVLPRQSLLIKSIKNGFSEMINEWSIGIIVLLFNWVLIIRLGEDGVAAYSIVEYLFFSVAMCYYGMSEVLPPLVSKNLGAGQPQRALSFLKMGLISIGFISVITFIVVHIFPEALVSIFLTDEQQGLRELSLRYLLWFSPTFLFIGFNICFSAYFTSIQKPLPSALIAVLRSLIFPTFFVFLLPLYLEEIGIFIAIAISEFITLCVSLLLWHFYKKKSLI